MKNKFKFKKIIYILNACFLFCFSFLLAGCEEGEKSNPSYVKPELTAVYGQSLKDLSLPEGFSFEDDSTTLVGNVGTNKFKVTYTPKDTENYNIITGIEIQITVKKAMPTYVVPTGLAANYNQTLASISLPAGFTFEEPLTAPVGNVGVNEFSVKYTPEDTDNYLVVTGIKVNITVSKTDPVYTLPTDIRATYGQTLGDITLPIGFSFVDDLSTSVGNVGIKTFKVKYVSSDSNYNEKEENIQVTVEKAVPEYTIPTGLTAVYEQTLSNITLPAGFSWEYPSRLVGETGKNTHTVTFTPEDTDNYFSVTGINVEVLVSKKTTTVNFPTGIEANYKQTLGDIVLPTGFSFVDPLTTEVGSVGINKFDVKYTPEDTNIKEIIQKVDVKVNPIDPVYELPTISAIYGQTLKDITLPAGFSFQDSLNTLVGNVGSNDFKVRYNTNNSNYNIIEDINLTITVNKDETNIIEGNIILENWKYNEEENTPTGLTSKHGQIIYKYSTSENGDYTTTVPTSAGTYYVKGFVEETNNYNGAESEAISFTIERATPEYTIPTGLTANYGQILEDVTLPEGFTWKDTTLSVGEIGTKTFTAIYTPDDINNYETVEVEVSVEVIAFKAANDISSQANTIVTYIKENLYNNEELLGIETEYSVAQIKEKKSDFNYYVRVGDIYFADLDSVKIGNVTITKDQTIQLSIGNSNYIVDKAYYIENNGLYVAAPIMAFETVISNSIEINESQYTLTLDTVVNSTLTISNVLFSGSNNTVTKNGEEYNASIVNGTEALGVIYEGAANGDVILRRSMYIDSSGDGYGLGYGFTEGETLDGVNCGYWLYLTSYTNDTSQLLPWDNTKAKYSVYVVGKGVFEIVINIDVVNE